MKTIKFPFLAETTWGGEVYIQVIFHDYNKTTILKGPVLPYEVYEVCETGWKISELSDEDIVKIGLGFAHE